MIAPILRAASYGDEKVSPSVVAFSEKMMHGTPIATLVEFLHALEVHDEDAGLRNLAKVPVLIACGDRDLITPVEHSEAMAAALAEVRAGDRQGRRTSGAVGAARVDRRCACPAGRAGHTGQTGRDDATGVGSGPSPWLISPREPQSCRPPRTPGCSAPGWVSSYALATWWCCPGRWVREKQCWPKESPMQWTWTDR